MTFVHRGADEEGWRALDARPQIFSFENIQAFLDHIRLGEFPPIRRAAPAAGTQEDPRLTRTSR